METVKYSDGTLYCVSSDSSFIPKHAGDLTMALDLCTVIRPRTTLDVHGVIDGLVGVQSCWSSAYNYVFPARTMTEFNYYYISLQI